MAKMVWQPGDTVGGPQKAYFTWGDGKPVHPVMKLPGRVMVFIDGAGNEYDKGELVLKVVKPEKALPQPGRKKMR